MNRQMTDHKNHNHSGMKCATEQDETVQSTGPGELKSTFRISGADCSDEVRAIKKSLLDIGIDSVSVNLVAATATVVHPSAFDIAKIRSAIESTGVKIVEKDDVSFLSTNQRRITLISISGLLLVTGILLDWTGNLAEPFSLVIFGAATLLGGVLVFPKALRATLQRSLDMNTLMSIAVIGAFAIKEYSEAATVVFLFSLAELLEAFSISRARQAIRAVLKLTPQIALVKKGDLLTETPVTKVNIDDLIVVRPGDSIPLDGIVSEGSSAVNQSPLTGESVPVDKKIGDQVFAGTINESGGLTVKVTKGFQDTKISRVIKLIEEAQQQKAPSERFVDRFAKIYTPIVFLGALAVAFLPPFLFGQAFDVWIYRALVLLVIACPCALVLATPISVVSGLASMARQGVLVKGGKYLEALGKIKAVALDKTGTLTEGKFKVQSYRGFNNSDEKQVQKIAAALERVSSHPLAKAVIEYTSESATPKTEVTEYTVIPGRGAQGRIESCLYFVGNHRLAHELGICNAEIESYLSELEAKALSVVIVGHKPHDDHKGDVMGIFGLGDNLKSHAKDAVRALHSVGVENIVVLSGDNQRTVDALCLLAGVDEGKGDLLPEDKVTAIKDLIVRYQNVAMVGDGVNDAPALASATIGISMGAAGTDAAIETSDVSLMQDDLSQLPNAIAQGRRVLNIIRFNIGFAIAIKAVFLTLAVIGRSNLWFAVAADMGASILVTLNALRLLRPIRAR